MHERSTGFANQGAKERNIMIENKSIQWEGYKKEEIYFSLFLSDSREKLGLKEAISFSNITLSWRRNGRFLFTSSIPASSNTALLFRCCFELTVDEQKLTRIIEISIYV